MTRGLGNRAMLYHHHEAFQEGRIHMRGNYVPFDKRNSFLCIVGPRIAEQASYIIRRFRSIVRHGGMFSLSMMKQIATAQSPADAPTWNQCRLLGRGMTAMRVEGPSPKADARCQRPIGVATISPWPTVTR